MSETPTLPISDEITDRVAQNANRILNDTQANDEFFRQAEYQVAPDKSRSERAATLDLHAEEKPDPRLWNREELETPVQVIERVEEALRPKLRAHEVEESLFYLTDKQLLAYAIANTKAVWALKHLV